MLGVLPMMMGDSAVPFFITIAVVYVVVTLRIRSILKMRVSGDKVEARLKTPATG
jgi:hypothetical protein